MSSSTSASGSIYSIFRWTGLSLKYSGAVRLPALYTFGERSPRFRFLVDRLLPLFSSALSYFAAISFVFLPPRKSFDRKLSDTLIVLFRLTVLVDRLAFPVVSYFRLSARLQRYLAQHAHIEILLRAQSERLRWFAQLSLVAHAALLLHAYTSVQWAHVRSGGERVALAHVLLWVYAYLALSRFGQPQHAYLVLQSALLSSFQQLLGRVSSYSREWRPEVKVRRLREVGRMYCQLCRMCVSLDDVVHPLLLSVFALCYVGEVHHLTFATSVGVAKVVGVVVSSSFLLAIPNIAYHCKRLANKILVAIYSSFDEDDPEIQKELRIFGLQSIQFKASFSASGFFELDRKFLFSVIQSIGVQWVVFSKLQTQALSTHHN